MPIATDIRPKHDANMLGLDYRAEAARLPYAGPIVDVHSHVVDADAAGDYFEVAALFGIKHTFSMTPLSNVDAILALPQAIGRISFIAVPDYTRGRDEPSAFTTEWLRDIESFAQRGAKICKFWAAPRGRDFPDAADALALDSPIRREGMRLARSLGMAFMTHVSDPDTWFATKYADAAKYGTKAQQYEPLRRMLEEFHDVPWIAAHLGGDPEHLDHLQALLDEYPHLHLDTSATKWMVRELSRQPAEFAAFCKRNAGRILFGSDIVARSQDDADTRFDLYASRYWALRTLIETAYDGPSPIVDPDLHMVDPSRPPLSTPPLRGASVDRALWPVLYRDAARALLDRLR